MSDPYARDAQIFTFGVHGTNNTPENVREVTQRISAAVGRTTDGANLWDNGFDWRARHTTEMVTTYDPVYGSIETPVTRPVPGTSHQMNGTADREIASQRFAAHVLQQVDNAIERGTLDRNKPLTLNLVGFSHGGNVSILAADEISEGMKQRGINAAIHVTTLSTPAYTWGPENPDTARDLVQADGVKFAHTHFNTPGDGVIRLAMARANYDTEITRNYDFPRAPFGPNGLANHGAVQNVPEMMDAAAEVMRQRFNGLAPAQQRSDAGGQDVRVAGVNPAAPAAPVDWNRFNADPMIQQASTALARAVPDAPQDTQNPSLLAGIAGVAAENRFRNVGDVAFGQNGQTAFVTDRDKADPAARVAPVDMALASKPTDQVVERFAAALETSRAQAVAQDTQEQQQRQSAPRMA
ncbi:MAG: hypothetical protein KF800_09420 [Lysobacter sp.]|nr:hypothetical protein [Lysobacter sp.]